MQAIKYYTEVLSDGYLAIPEEIKKKFSIRKGEKLEVILSYITVKSRADQIKSLQKQMRQSVKGKKQKLSLKKIDKLVHEIRQT